MPNLMPGDGGNRTSGTGGLVLLGLALLALALWGAVALGGR